MVTVMDRVKWLKWVWRYGRPAARKEQTILLFTYEIYYQLCKLRGYRVLHLLEDAPVGPAPEEMRRLEGTYIAVWPPLPLSIRLLDRIFPFGKYAHSKLVPYTPEAAEEIRRSGARAELREFSPVLIHLPSR
jgi:hypothetical protein